MLSWRQAESEQTSEKRYSLHILVPGLHQSLVIALGQGGPGIRYVLVVMPSFPDVRPTNRDELDTFRVQGWYLRVHGFCLEVVAMTRTVQR